MYICNESMFDYCDIKCEHHKVHESVNCCDERVRFCDKARNIVKCNYIK